MAASTPPGAAQLGLELDSAVVFSAKDLAFELTVTRAILRSLEVEQILYVVLSGITAAEGLGFHRAVFFLADDGARNLHASLAIGPADEAEAHRIWEDMKAQELTLSGLLADYEAVFEKPDAHQLTRKLSGLRVPLTQLSMLAAEVPSGVVPTKETGAIPVEAMLARCLLEQQPIRSRERELEWNSPDGEKIVWRRWWMVPLVTPERVVGVLLADDIYAEREVSQADRYLLLALSNLAAIAVEKGRMFSRMKALAEADGLTGVANRRSYEQRMETMLAKAVRSGRPLSLIVFDVDHFKRFNDRHGHLVGDDALRFVAKMLSTHARPTDLCARYGGEEFVLVLPDTASALAQQVANRMLELVHGKSLEEGLPEPLTLSAGVAEWKQSDEARSLFDRADRALYRAKELGRARVVLSEA